MLSFAGGTNDERVTSISGHHSHGYRGKRVVLLNKKTGLRASLSRLFATQMRCLL